MSIMSYISSTKVQFSMRISIRNEQFSGFEDSMCKAILNDNSVTFTILMRCLELIKRASFFLYC